MIDKGKLNSAVGKISFHDAEIRIGLRNFAALVVRDKENIKSIISEAQKREVDHRRQVYNILKKLFKDYQTEMSSATNILMGLTDKQDRCLSLSKKMMKGAGHD